MISNTATAALAAIDTASLEAFKASGAAISKACVGTDQEFAAEVEKLGAWVRILVEQYAVLKDENAAILARSPLRWQLERSLEGMR